METRINGRFWPYRNSYALNHTWNGLQERLAGCGDVNPDMGDRQLDTLLEFFLQTFYVML